MNKIGELVVSLCVAFILIFLSTLAIVTPAMLAWKLIVKIMEWVG